MSQAVSHFLRSCFFHRRNFNKWMTFISKFAVLWTFAEFDFFLLYVISARRIDLLHCNLFPAVIVIVTVSGFVEWWDYSFAWGRRRLYKIGFDLLAREPDLAFFSLLVIWNEKTVTCSFNLDSLQTLRLCSNLVWAKASVEIVILIIHLLLKLLVFVLINEFALCYGLCDRR